MVDRSKYSPGHPLRSFGSHLKNPRLLSSEPNSPCDHAAPAALCEAIPDCPELRRVRVVVYENPFARIEYFGKLRFAFVDQIVILRYTPILSAFLELVKV